MGKAAAGMYRGWVSQQGEPGHRMMVVPVGWDAPDWALRGEHPIPGEQSLRAGEAVLSFIQRLPASGVDGPVLLLSGGASAIVCAPLAGVPVAEYQECIGSLLKAGVSIGELNTVRKHAERLKGGRMAEMLPGLPIECYTLSDVIGDDPGVIASGPVAPDPTTYADAIAVLDHRLVRCPAFRRLLQRGSQGDLHETPKPDNKAFSKVRTKVVGNNDLAIDAAAAAVAEMGWGDVQIARAITGDARKAAELLVERFRLLGQPAALVWGGETTVDAGGSPGRGGRAQEWVLAAAAALSGTDRRLVACFGTDGVDGSTAAAGAVATGETTAQATWLGRDVAAALAKHDSYGLFSVLENAGYPHLIRTGQTGTNVDDVGVLLAY
jgi:glycerate 2-kinase